jgi:hypothetical protein
MWFKRNKTVANAHIILEDKEKTDIEYVNADRLFPMNSKGVVDLNGGVSKGKPIVDVYIQKMEWDTLQNDIKLKNDGKERYFPSIRGDLRQSYDALGLWETKLINFKYKDVTTDRPAVHWVEPEI